MPYKDPEPKKQWELQHRAQRVARRRNLRRMETVQRPQQSPPPGGSTAEPAVSWVPFAGSVAVAIYNPKLATGLGASTLIAAAALKKDWRWWLFGVVSMVLGLFFCWNNITKTEHYVGVGQ